MKNLILVPDGWPCRRVEAYNGAGEFFGGAGNAELVQPLRVEWVTEDWEPLTSSDT